jgi:WD40 repeat protein
MDINSINEHYVIGTGEGSIQVFDSNNNKEIIKYDKGSFSNIGHTSKINSVKFASWHNNIIVSCGWDGTLLIFDTREKKCIKDYYGYKMESDLIDFNNKRREILIGNNCKDNKQLGIYDFSKFELIEEIKIPDNYNFNTAKYTKNNLIYTGSMSYNGISIFDNNNGKSNYYNIYDINNFTGTLFNVDISYDIKTMVSATSNNLYIFSIDRLL